jgi:HK97 family phage major capsid protein
VAWIAEGSATTLSGLTFRQIPMVPKTIRGAQAFSRKMMMQASLDVESLVRNDLTMSIGVELDRVGLNGSGAGAEPRGLLNMASIGSVTTTGAGLTWAAVCELESDVAIANADIGSLAFCTNARVRGKAKQTLKMSTATNGVTLWEALTAMYPAEVTNNMPSTLGVGGNASACVFGNWNDLMIGLWSGQEVLVDPYSRSLYGEIQVVMFQEADIAARHEDSFSAVQDLITT